MFFSREREAHPKRDLCWPRSSSGWEGKTFSEFLSQPDEDILPMLSARNMPSTRSTRVRRCRPGASGIRFRLPWTARMGIRAATNTRLCQSNCRREAGSAAEMPTLDCAPSGGGPLLRWDGRSVAESGSGPAFLWIYLLNVRTRRAGCNSCSCRQQGIGNTTCFAIAKPS